MTICCGCNYAVKMCNYPHFLLQRCGKVCGYGQCHGFSALVARWVLLGGWWRCFKRRSSSFLVKLEHIPRKSFLVNHCLECVLCNCNYLLRGLSCRLCVTFLLCDIMIFIVCIAATCLYCLSVCCCLPCILAILPALTNKVEITMRNVCKL